MVCSDDEAEDVDEVLAFGPPTVVELLGIAVVVVPAEADAEIVVLMASLVCDWEEDVMILEAALLAVVEVLLLLWSVLVLAVEEVTPLAGRVVDVDVAVAI